MIFDKKQFYVFLLVIVTISYRIIIILQPFPVLIDKIVADDTFYYLCIARNVVQGNGVTFDGEVLTNGFHPLLLVVEIIMMYLIPDELYTSSLPVRLILVIFMIIDCLIALLLYRITQSFCLHYGPIIALGLWLFHPEILATSFSGVESGFAALFFCFVTRELIIITDKRMREYKNNALRMGFFISMIMLSRTDCFLFGLLASGIFIYHLVNKSPDGSRIKSLFRFIVCPICLILPWLLWNWLNFGRIIQDSGRALSYLHHYLYLTQTGSNYFSIAVYQLQKVFSFLAEIWTGNIILSLIMWIIIVFCFINRLKQLPKEKNLALFPCFAHLLFIIGFYALYFWHMQRWYFTSVFPILVIVLSVGGDYLWHMFQEIEIINSHSKLRRLIGTAILVSLLVLLIMNSYSLWHQGVYPWQSLVLEAVQVLKPVLYKNGEKVGAFNAGLLGYLLPNKVINLDGVVNGEVYDAYVNKRWTQYVYENQIEFIADFDYIIRLYAQFGEEQSVRKWRLMSKWENKYAPSDFVILNTGFY